jgi:hypothetical protein
MLVEHCPRANADRQGETSMNKENSKAQNWHKEDIYCVGKRRGAHPHIENNEIAISIESSSSRLSIPIL